MVGDMSNLIRWQRTGDKVGEVHLEFSSGGNGWKRYNLHPLHQPDLMPRSSKGYRTAQILLGAGYIYEQR